MSRAAFACFRALTRFGDLPLRAKLLRVTFFPYFLARAALGKDKAPPGAPRACAAALASVEATQTLMRRRAQ